VPDSRKKLPPRLYSLILLLPLSTNKTLGLEAAIRRVPMETRSLTGEGVDMAAGIRVGVTVGERLAAGFAAVVTVERGMGVAAGLGVGLGIRVGQMVGVGSGVEVGVAVVVGTMVGAGTGVKVRVAVAVGAISTTAAVEVVWEI